MTLARDVQAIGGMIRQQRKALQLTQKEAADLCQVGVRFFSELENGKLTLQIGKVMRILQQFGLEMDIRSRRS